MSAGSHAPAPRIASVDLLRGLVMIVMALDHSRDFFLSLPYPPEDLTQASPALFFTRWITHFCAPVFVFLAGVSAWLYARNTRATPAQLSRFLWTRALWLFFIEIAVFSASWRFSFDWTVLQVIWAIGCSLLLLSIVCRFSWRVSVVLGLAIVLGHNLLDPLEPADFGRFALLWNLLHVPRFDFAIGDHPVWILYPVLPWMGVLLLGYAWGAVLTRDVTPAGVSWQRLSISIGGAAIVLFALLRGFNLYGDPDPWQVQPRGALFSFLDVLNTTKYPPSLAFLLMTLGPALVLMPLLEHWRGKLAQIVSVFGRVPFFFYVLHFPLIHALYRVRAHVSLGGPWDVFFRPPPAAYEPSLARAYLVWAFVVFVLYWPCRWFADLKRRRRDWWLSYL